MQLLPRITQANMGNTHKVFLVSYPYPGIQKCLAHFKDRKWTVIYDCRDDWEEFAKVGMARWYHKEIEQTVAAEADVTLCVSRVLCEKLRHMTDKPVLLSPNAVDEKFLPKGYQRRPKTNPRVVGYFGHLAPAWFDWEAVVKIAQRLPDIRFELIGHSVPQNIDLPKNIILVGALPWAELHHYASGWSAGIIPFRMGPLADGVDPIKVYEYLAFGLPVVSFRMPQIADYPYTCMVETVTQFCLALKDACRLTPEPAVIEEFIRRNTWQTRVDELISVADQVEQ